MSESDFDVENLFAPKRKKGVNSGSKGKRVERELCKQLITRFSLLLNQNPTWGQFSRSIGSGNRWGQKVVLSEKAVDTFSGDISVPSNFRFVLESKGGYNDVDLISAFEGGNKQIDEFLGQVSDDSDRCGRDPVLLWKKDRKPRLAFFKTGTVPAAFEAGLQYTMKYRDWTVYLFEDILKLPDEFFFVLPTTTPPAGITIR